MMIFQEIDLPIQYNAYILYKMHKYCSLAKHYFFFL